MYDIENQGDQYLYCCAAFDRYGGGQLNGGEYLCFGKNADRVRRSQKLTAFACCGRLLYESRTKGAYKF